MNENQDIIDYITEMKVDDSFAVGTESSGKIFFKKIDDTNFEVVSGVIIDRVGSPIRTPMTKVIELLESKNYDD